MKAHVLFSSDEHTNGQVVGVFSSREKAEAHFYLYAHELSEKIGDDEYETSCTFDDDCWTYMPDDIEEHENVKVMLFLDMQVVE